MVGNETERDMNLIPQQQKTSALAVMAGKYSVEPTKLLDTLKATVFQGASNEELLALVVVANQYGLNPFTREIYAFPKKGGGIQPVVSIDGWIRMMNDAEGFDGIEFAFRDTDGDLSCTATIHHKNRSKPTSVTEYRSECERNTEPWKVAPRRMLRHRALIQCARVAFGFGGISDPEEVAMIEPDPVPRDITPQPKQLPAAETANEKPDLTPQERLADAVLAAGFTFTDLQEWAIEQGTIPAADTLESFDAILPETATRLLRATKGLLHQLKEMKARAK